MPVLISDLWTPSVWVDEMRERQATFPSVFNAGIVQRSPLFDEIASGAGTSANIPFFRDITDQSDEIQVENTAPTDLGHPGGLMVAPILNRVTKNSVGALAAQVSGSDPVGSIVSQLVARRLKQRQRTLVACLRGAFNATAAANAAAPLSAVRYGGTTSEIFLETTSGQTAANWISIDTFINLKMLMGELADDLSGGCFLCHPTIKGRLENLDGVNFKTGRPSELPFDITTYRGIPIFTSELLVRPGSTSGFVYDSYLIARGVFAYGEKPQQGDTVDVASLSYFQDKDKNNEAIYDRTRFMMILNGMRWVGNPAGQSASNEELQTASNWSLVYQTANRCGVACIRTNG